MYFTTIYLFLWIETTCRIHKHSCHKQHGPGSLDTFPPIWWLVSLAKYKITKRFRWNKIKTNTLFNVKILKNICICKLILLSLYICFLWLMVSFVWIKVSIYVVQLSMFLLLLFVLLICLFIIIVYFLLGVFRQTPFTGFPCACIVYGSDPNFQYRY